MTDLFERSCAHWSEAKRREMEDFYALATADYRHLAEAFDWRAWLERRQREVGERWLRLLDIACGSGKFPAALIRHADVAAASVKPIDYALLDPSGFSIREARRALDLPFVAGPEYEIPLQELSCAAGGFDIVWATHALYALPREELDLSLARFTEALRGGCGMIAHACSDAHYVRFHQAYLEAFKDGVGATFTTAEEIVAALERLGVDVEATDLHYETVASEAAEGHVEGFLQRCVFDDAVGLQDLLAREPTARYLSACFSAGAWRFPQRVKLIFLRA
ncbi:MAG: class I SAM-dependent methyltransferase [Pseudomonadota bacterium]